jgi:hypothetical protein
MEKGRIVEAGTHAELLALGGLYEKLWRHQSGGFLADDLFESDEVEVEADNQDTEIRQAPPVQ